MFTTGLGARHARCWVFCFVFALGVHWVIGRPQPTQSAYDGGAEGQGSLQSALRFSPELILEPSLESAVSPASLNPRPVPPSHPSPNHAPPSSHVNEGDAGDRSKDFPKGLDGSEEKWKRDTHTDSQVPPAQGRPEKTPALPVDKEVVSPVVQDDINVDRYHAKLLSFNKDDGNEDLDLPELRLKDPGPLQAALGRAGYIRTPHRALPKGIPTPDVKARHVDVNGPPSPSAHAPVPKSVPADARQIAPWQQVLQKDVNVDRHGQHGSPIPASQPGPTVPDASLDWFKMLALEDLMEADGAGDDSTDVDLKGGKNPFDDSEEEGGEVPEELVRQVIKAMENPSPRGPWAPSAMQEGGLWEDSDADDSDEDQYGDWDPINSQESRLITLIFKTMDGSDGMGEDSEAELEEAISADEYERELSIWQILTNFPFPMLLSHNDIVDSIDIDYTYDDEDDYDDDDDDDEYDDYSDEYYDDYEDYDDDDDDDDDDEDYNSEDVSDKLDDYFYSSEEYVDCDDCTEDDSNAEQELTVLSLPPILTK